VCVFLWFCWWEKKKLKRCGRLIYESWTEKGRARVPGTSFELAGGRTPARNSPYSGEKFAQPGGAKIRDFRESKRRRLWDIYRSKNPWQTPTKSVRFSRSTSPRRSRTRPGVLAEGWRCSAGPTVREKKRKVNERRKGKTGRVRPASRELLLARMCVPGWAVWPGRPVGQFIFFLLSLFCSFLNLLI
jgi:hypothetical protein